MTAEQAWSAAQKQGLAAAQGILTPWSEDAGNYVYDPSRIREAKRVAAVVAQRTFAELLAREAAAGVEAFTASNQLRKGEVVAQRSLAPPLSVKAASINGEPT